MMCSRLNSKTFGVHAENQDVFRNLQLGLELAPVAVLDLHFVLSFLLEGVVDFRRHFMQHFFQAAENRERVVEHFLAQRCFLAQFLDQAASYTAGVTVHSLFDWLMSVFYYLSVWSF